MLLPGLALTGAIAALAYGLRTVLGIPFLSPLILSLVLGIVVQNTIGLPKLAQPGTTFAMKRLLRLAIILLGLQLTLAQIGEMGLSGLLTILACTGLTFLFTKKAGAWIGVEPKLTELIAAGTSICGASAVIATNTVTRASDEDVAYAIACVTIFGSLAVLTYPLLGSLLGLDPHQFGLWSGASIHEIAQVVATGLSGWHHGRRIRHDRQAHPCVAAGADGAFFLTALARHKVRSGATQDKEPLPLPWFVLGFIALVCLNSFVTLPVSIKTEVGNLTTILLSMALAAMGLGTDISKLKAKGAKPLVLGLVSFLFVAGLGLCLVTWL